MAYYDFEMMHPNANAEFRVVLEVVPGNTPIAVGAAFLSRRKPGSAFMVRSWERVSRLDIPGRVNVERQKYA